MDKGIRPAANAKFMQELPTRATIGNTAFRKNVMFYLMEEFGCTNPAAATHYNHAFKACKAAHPELVEGLGRPEGKNNGGRKKKIVVERPVSTDPAWPWPTAAQVAAGQELVPVQEEVAPEPIPEPTPVIELFTVRTKKGGNTVAEGLTKEAAEQLVAKAKAAKKAALEIA